MKKILGAAVIAAGVGQLAIGSVAQAATSSSSQAVMRYTKTLTNVRTAASVSSAKFGMLPAGTPVSGTLLPNGWIKVTTPKADAGRYVSNTVLTDVVPGVGSIATDSGNPISGVIMSFDHKINVRSGPGFTYPIVTHLGAAQKVSGITSGAWIKVASGYINRGLIETTSSSVGSLNGNMNLHAMCSVPLAWNSPASFDPGYTSQTPRYFSCYGMSGLNQLEADFAAKFGHPAQIDLTYRDYGEETFWWQTKRYAAAPIGTSNHGWGLAVDFREDVGVDDEFNWDAVGYNWLAANASKYGFAGDPVPHGTAEESYHWNFVG